MGGEETQRREEEGKGGQGRGSKRWVPHKGQVPAIGVRAGLRNKNKTLCPGKGRRKETRGLGDQGDPSTRMAGTSPPVLRSHQPLSPGRKPLTQPPLHRGQDSAHILPPS